MCIKCVLTELMAEEKAKQAAQAAGITTSEAGAGQSFENYMSGSEEQTQAQAVAPVDLSAELLKAQIRNTDADTVVKLAHAATSLYHINLPTENVMRAMDQLLPTAPQPAPLVNAAEAEAPTTPANDTDGLPPEMVELIKQFESIGMKVEVVRASL